jgi:hypothetical protein
LSSSGVFTANLDQLYLNVQPFSISTTSSLPELQYANIEFNVVVKEGMLQTSAYPGYNFLYKRTTAHNTLKIGFIPGRAGPYIIFCTNNRYYNNGMAAFYRPNDQCTTYWVSALFRKFNRIKIIGTSWALPVSLSLLVMEILLYQKI